MTENPDGTLRVEGLVTAERPDLDSEVCDYATTVPYYKAKFAAMLKATDVPGMEPSIMPLRYMHQLDAVGKGLEASFSDEAKEIRMAFEVVDPACILKVRKGVLSGFSQGGSYVDTWKDTVFKGCKRYTADPGEVSLVDAPCLPGATITAIKGKTYEYEKADGTKELRKMLSKSSDCTCDCEPCENGNCAECTNPDCDQAGCVHDPEREADAEEVDAETLKALSQTVTGNLTLGDGRTYMVKGGKIVPTAKAVKTKTVAGEILKFDAFAYVGDAQNQATWKLPIKFSTPEKSKSHVRYALMRCSSVGIPAEALKVVKPVLKTAALDHGINLMAEAEQIARAFCGLATGMKKGMYQVAQLAEMAETLSWIQSMTAWERECEKDSSTLPEDLQSLLADMVSCLEKMLQEESAEIMQQAAAVIESTTAMEGKSMDIDLAKLSGEALEKAKAHLKAAHMHMVKALQNSGEMMAHCAKMSEQYSGMAKAHADLSEMHKAHGAVLAQAMDSLGKALGTPENPSGQISGGAEKAAGGGADTPLVPVAPVVPDKPAEEPVAAPVVKADTFTKAEVETMISAAIDKAVTGLKAESDPANKVKLTLVPRPGDEVQKADSPAASTGAIAI